MPQPPQFWASLEIFTHAPLHKLRPASQITPQPLPLQVGTPLATAGHTLPHAPQFLTSFVLSTQTVPQRMVGRLH